VYRRQSQVDRRRSIWVLFEGNPVSCDHRPAEASRGSEQYQSMNSRIA
jgi:hypothetical protein